MECKVIQATKHVAVDAVSETGSIFVQTEIPLEGSERIGFGCTCLVSQCSISSCTSILSASERIFGLGLQDCSPVSSFVPRGQSCGLKPASKPRTDFLFLRQI